MRPLRPAPSRRRICVNTQLGEMRAVRQPPANQKNVAPTARQPICQPPDNPPFPYARGASYSEQAARAPAGYATLRLVEALCIETAKSRRLSRWSSTPHGTRSMRLQVRGADAAALDPIGDFNLRGWRPRNRKCGFASPSAARRRTRDGARDIGDGSPASDQATVVWAFA